MIDPAGGEYEEKRIDWTDPHVMEAQGKALLWEGWRMVHHETIDVDGIRTARTVWRRKKETP